MKKRQLPTLLAVFVLALVAYFVVDRWCIVYEDREDIPQMQQASALAERWFHIVAVKKQEIGIYQRKNHTEYDALLGEEYSDITTTLGSVEAKTSAANPLFAAVLVRMLDDAGIDSTKTIGITLSGSFPSLSIATLAAVQTVGAKAVIFSSLGASSYGANQPKATWIDIEHWLREQGGLKLKSKYVTYGGECDTGGGISDEGRAMLKQAVARNHANLFVPSSFDDAIDKRTTVFRENHIRLLINIGGNQTSLGSCSHSTTIPNGYHQILRSCMDHDRGILVRMSEYGVPVIHLLYIKDLASKYGLPLIPDGEIPNRQLYSETTVRKVPVYLFIILLVSSILIIRFKKFYKE
jgi:poly-gamma-glutamate system protein